MSVSFFALALVVSASAGSIDLSEGWRFRAAAGGDGDSSAVDLDDSTWSVVRAGARWEDQGFPDVDGHAWYRKRVTVAAEWRGGRVWLVLGGVNDACVVYCNGRRINSFGDESETSVNGVALIADLTDAVRFGAENVLAIDVLDWGGSGGLWRRPCLLVRDTSELPLDSAIMCIPDSSSRQCLVGVSLAGFGNDRPELTLKAEARRAGSPELIGSATKPIAADADTVMAALDLSAAAPGESIDIAVSFETSSGDLFYGITQMTSITWGHAARWQGKYADLKPLNNFVTILLDIESNDDSAAKRFTFPNPRDGWVFFRVSSGANSAAQPRMFLDASAEPMRWRVNPDTGALEAMRRLDEGEHALTLEHAAGFSLSVRTVPEMVYCYFPATPHIRAYGDYDWPFVERHVLPHVNTIVTSGKVGDDHFKQWVDEGRQWLSNSGLPGMNDADPPTADAVYAQWSENPGYTQPGYGGIIVDEFLWTGQGHYTAWEDALRRLNAVPDFSGRTFYAWCLDMFAHEPALEFSRALMEMSGRFAWEKYLDEKPTREDALLEVHRALVQPMLEWEKAAPGIQRHMVMCLGYLCAPPESVNLNPAVDYHVFLEMQFRTLATEAAFWNLYGVMEYSASYADEESLRVAHQLIRHYCIEGNTEPLITDPYALEHIGNPDFLEGLDAWEVVPAGSNSIRIDSIEGFSFLSGRYPRTSVGDQFCVFERVGGKENQLAQSVKGLEPGRLYSVKLVAADIDRLHDARQLPLRVEVEGAEHIPESSFQFVYASNYAHEVPPYNRENPAHFNLFRVVFRATSDAARLVVSEQSIDAAADGQSTQRIAFNFVEVQPFHAAPPPFESASKGE